MTDARAPHPEMAIKFIQLLLACLIISSLAWTPSGAQLKPVSGQREIRGVWVHPSLFGAGKDTAAANIRRVLDSYREAGINTIMLLVKSTSGLVCYNSTIAPVDPAWSWDFAGTFIAEAQKRNMEVHPWFCVFTEGAKAGEIQKHPEWLIQNKSQEPMDIVNPSLEEVRSYERSIILEFVKLYPVDWIHLDYIRYPCEPVEPYFSFDQDTRRRFRHLYGEDPVEIKHNNSGNVLWNEWIEWDGEQVTTFMRELRQSLKSSQRRVQISAAVFPDAAISKVLIGQDWAQWARENLVDMICPMLYTNSDILFVKYLRRSLTHAKFHGQLCAGIGISTAHNQNTAAGVLHQIQLTKQEKAQGFVLFSSSSLKSELLDGMRISR